MKSQSAKTDSTAVVLNSQTLKQAAKDKLKGELSDSLISGYKAVGDGTGKVVLAFRYSSKITNNRPTMRIGVFGGEVTAEEARTIAKGYAQLVLAGGDPARDRDQRQADAKRARLSLFGDFVKGHYTELAKDHTDGGKLALEILEREFSHLNDMPLSAINEGDLVRWVKRREREVKFSTLRRALAVIKPVSKAAFKMGLIPDNAIGRFELADHYNIANAPQKEPKAKREALTLEEATALFVGISEADREAREDKHNRSHYVYRHGYFAHESTPFFLLAFWVGLRPGDLTGLEWQHVRGAFMEAPDCEVGATPPGSIVKVQEKIRRKLLKTKTVEEAQTDFPLNREATAVLHQWWLQCGTPTTGLVFPSERLDGERHDRGWYKKAWERVLRHAEITDLDLYELRHNFGSQLLNSGVSSFVAAKLMGHSDTKMIERIYGHLNTQTAHAAHDMIKIRPVYDNQQGATPNE